MTVEKKRAMVAGYCTRLGLICDGCTLKDYKWKHCTGRGCLDLDGADEEELDRALELIGAVLPVVMETEGASENSKTAAVIQLEVKDNSPMQIAYAIRNYIWEYYGKDYEIALIALDELTEHIDAYVRAERKALEYKKLAEEG